MFLRAIAISDDRRQTHMIALTHLDCDPLAHAQPLSPSQAYTVRTLLSDVAWYVAASNATTAIS